MDKKQYVLFLIVFILYILLVSRVTVINYNYLYGLDPNIYMMAISVSLHYIFGVLLGVEHLLRQFRQKGTWGFNSLRFFILGIPSLLLSIDVTFLYLRVSSNFTTILSSTFFLFFRVVFGYVFITSLIKRNH